MSGPLWTYGDVVGFIWHFWMAFAVAVSIIFIVRGFTED